MLIDVEKFLKNKKNYDFIINLPTMTIDTSLYNDISESGNFIKFKNTYANICGGKSQIEVKKDELQNYLNSKLGSIIIKGKKGFPFDGGVMNPYVE